MGCQLNLKNRNEQNFMEEELNINITPREKKMVVNQIRIRPQAFITQYKMFPESKDHLRNFRKENSYSQSEVFNSGRYVPLSTIQPIEQPQSPDLTPLLLIKQMENQEFKDNEVNKETMHLTEKPSKKSKKHKHKRIDMQTLEAQF